MDWLKAAGMPDMLPEQFDVTYIYIIAGAAAVYIVIRPFITWMVSTRSVKLLNYVLTSLLILVFLLGGMALTTFFQSSLLDITLRSLAFFGGSLGIIHLLQHIFRHSKKRV